MGKFKRAFIGGIIASIIDGVETGLRHFSPDYPAELRQRIVAGTPQLGNLLSVGGPLAAGLVMRRKYKTKDLGSGMAMYSAPRLLHEFVIEAEMAQRTQVGFSHRATAPYVTKAERLPFQTDLTY